MLSLARVTCMPRFLARSATGITQEKATREKIARERREFERSMLDDSDDNMEIMYRYLLMSASGMLGYRSLMRSIIELPEGAALWHCSVGRDRCGLCFCSLRPCSE